MARYHRITETQRNVLANLFASRNIPVGERQLDTPLYYHGRLQKTFDVLLRLGLVVRVEGQYDTGILTPKGEGGASDAWASLGDGSKVFVAVEG